MEKEKVAQQCHDLQQELAMEAEHRQEMTEEVKRLKKEVNSRCSDVAINCRNAFEVACEKPINSFVNLLFIIICANVYWEYLKGLI